MIEFYVHFTLAFLPVLAWLLRYGHLSFAQKILGATACLTLLTELYAFYLLSQLTRNLYLYHLLIPLQFTLFSLLFYTTLSSRLEKKIISLSVPAYLLLVLLSSLYLQKITEFNSYARIGRNVFLICWVLLYYREVFIGLRINNLAKEPMFWAATGLLFFALGSFFTDGLMNHMLTLSYELAHALNYISIFLKYLLNITFLVALLLTGKQEPEKKSYA